MYKPLLATVLFAIPFCAATVTLEYKTFYSHLRQLDKPELDQLQFAFGFKHISEGRLCKLSKVRLLTQKQQVNIAVSPQGRFTLPTEKALKLANAMVEVSMSEPENRCDMSVQLETRPELLANPMPAQDLRLILQQYQYFFDKMGSFLAFLFPAVEGLVIQPQQGAPIELKSQWIEANQAPLKLTEPPRRITPLIKR